MVPYIDELMQERQNSIANTLELLLSCTNPSTFASSQCNSFKDPALLDFFPGCLVIQWVAETGFQIQYQGSSPSNGHQGARPITGLCMSNILAWSKKVQYKWYTIQMLHCTQRWVTFFDLVLCMKIFSTIMLNTELIRYIHYFWQEIWALIQYKDVVLPV